MNVRGRSIILYTLRILKKVDIYIYIIKKSVGNRTAQQKHKMQQKKSDERTNG